MASWVAYLGAVLAGAGCLMLYVLLGAGWGAGAGGGGGGGGAGSPMDKVKPQGLVSGFKKPATTLSELDKGHIYRFKATDHEYYAALWKEQQTVAPTILNVKGFQGYVDSSPELSKMQADCLAPPDKKFYDQFTLNTPHVKTGDETLIRGVNSHNGMHVGDGVIAISKPHKVALKSGIYGIRQDLAEAIDSPGGMNNSGNYYYPPGGFREWHTNKCQQTNTKHYSFGTTDPIYESSQDCKGARSTGGWRGYMVYAEEEGKSWMSVIDGGGSFRTLMDRSGYVSLFYLPGGEENSWHTIFSQTHRWSIGFRITDKFIADWMLPDLQRNNVEIEDIELNLNQNWLGRLGAGNG